MPAPTGADGVGRAIQEVFVPPVGVFMIVVFIKEFVGPVVAGLVYLLMLAGIFLGIYTSAKYWNISYTTGFVLSGIVLIWMAPGIISTVIHPVFGLLGTLTGIVFLGGMALLLIDKSGLDDMLKR
jgi:dolichyl-phosphate-mannose--protein O-mannosyl transferase